MSSPNELYLILYCTMQKRGEIVLTCTFLLQFNDYINTIFSSPPTVALFVSVLLDNTLDVRDAARDRGMPWWARFRTFRGDSRNEEFYTLPFNLNRFFPPSWGKGKPLKSKDAASQILNKLLALRCAFHRVEQQLQEKVFCQKRESWTKAELTPRSTSIVHKWFRFKYRSMIKEQECRIFDIVWF